MQPYQLCLKDQLTTYKFNSDEDSRIEHLCQLIQDAGDLYVSLIFEDYFNVVKRFAFIQSLYKCHYVKLGTQFTLSDRFKLPNFGYNIVEFSYNKCPFCDKQFKMINHSKMKGDPQPGKSLITHLVSKHNCDLKIVIKQKNFREYVSIY